MRILILGGDGMLGHQFLDFFQNKHEVRCTVRRQLSDYSKIPLFSTENTYFGIDLREMNQIVEILNSFRPEVILNCVGVVKQRHSATDFDISLEINALLPHRLARVCSAVNARLVHFSTDCIFSGGKGSYRENDLFDAHDLYGKTKLLGEVHYPNSLTLRTSIIGRELFNKKSLIEWFLAQQGKIKGFRNAIYSGFTTIEMSRIVEMMITNYSEASGVYHVSSQPISKYDLLRLVSEKLSHEIEIEPDDEFTCDRSLDSNRFRTAFNYSPPSWDEMIRELAVQKRWAPIQ